MREEKEKIIHRDLKLENIMIKYDKNIPVLGYIVKLSDFGLSKELNENELTATIVGTPLTQAPEVLCKEKYDSKCDLWSIGVIIYQLIFDRIPFNVKSKQELIDKIKKMKKLDIPKDIPVSNECIDLLNKLFQKDREKRITFEQYF